MASVSAVEKSLNAEGGVHTAANSAEAEAKQSAGTAANDPGTSMQVDSVGSENDTMPPNDGRNGATHAGANGVADGDGSLLDSLVFSGRQQYAMDRVRCRHASEAEGQEPIRDGNGQLLLDED